MGISRACAGKWVNRGGWLAVGQDGLVAGIGGRAARGAVGVVDAGDEGPRIHVRVVAGHDAAQAGFAGDDLAVKDGVAGELGDPGFGRAAGRAGQRRAVAVGARLGEELAPGGGRFGFDLVAEHPGRKRGLAPVRLGLVVDQAAAGSGSGMAKRRMAAHPAWRVWVGRELKGTPRSVG